MHSLTEKSEAEIRVAILEDEEMLRQCLGDLLDRSGFRVVASESRADTFMMTVGQVDADVALVDLMLKGPTGLNRTAGLDVLRQLRSQRKDIRPVILTALKEPELFHVCLEEGAVGYLCKQDVSTTDVINAIRKAASGEQVPAHRLPEQPEAPSGFGHSALETLTRREQEVLAYVSAGADNRTIAARLGCAERTVKAHMGKLYRKLRVENRVELTLMARRLGVRTPQN